MIMKGTHFIWSGILGALLLSFCTVIPAFAVEKNKGKEIQQNSRVVQYNKPMWGKHTSKRTGLYTIKNKAVSNGVCLDLNALYYYGDIDMLDQAFVHGFQPQNLSLGGSLHFGYLMPLGRYCNWRFTLGGGYLHGNDSARHDINSKGIKVPAGKGVFSSIFGEANVGVEFYPFPRAGLYLYAGLGFAVSYIDYDFYKTRYPKGTTVSVLPMLPLEIGYNFYLGSSCFLALSLSVHQGLMDLGHVNLDAWPLEKSSQFQWGDGYFQIGLTFSYRWHKCEVCRHSKW